MNAAELKEKARPLAWPGLFLLALLIGGVAFFHIREARETQRAYRILSGVAARIEARLSDLAAAFSSQIERGPDFDAERFLKTTDFEIEDRTFRQPGREPSASLDISADGRWLNLAYTGPSTAREELWVSLKAKQPLDEVVKPIVDEIPFFDSVLLAGANGDVLHETPPDRPRVATLKALLDYKDEASLYRAAAAGGLHKVSFAGSEYAVLARPVRAPLLLAPSLARTSVEAEPAGDRRGLVICGLVEIGKLRQASLSFPRNFLIALVSLLVLCAFVLPLLRLISHPPPEEDRKGYAAVAVASTVVAVAFGCFLFWDLRAYLHLRNQFDGSLKGLATRIDEHVTEELNLAQNQLTQLSPLWQQIESPCQYVEKVVPPTEKVTDNTEQPTPQGQCDQQNDRDLIASGFAIPPGSTGYSPIRSIAWVDGEGDQIAKWTLRELATPLVSVSERSYFRELTAIRELTAKEDDFSPAKLWFESIRSLASANREAVLARRLKPENLSAPRVLALGLRPLSLMDTALPFGYRFAVVDDEGTVHFHSEEWRNGHENLFAEVSSPQPLRGKVLSGREGFVRGVHGYDGRQYRFYSRPLSWTQQHQDRWTLVVLRDHDMLEVAHLEMLSLGSFHLVPLVLLALLAIFGSWPLGRMWRSWQQSRTKRAAKDTAPPKQDLQRVLFLATLGAVAQLLLAWLLLATLWPGLPTAGGVLAILLFASGVLWRGILVLMPARTGRRQRATLAVSAVLLLLAAAIFPLRVPAALAYQDVSTRLVGFGQAELAERLAKREEELAKIESWAGDLKGLADLGSYEEVFFETQHVAAGATLMACEPSEEPQGVLAGWRSWARDRVPYFDEDFAPRLRLVSLTHTSDSQHTAAPAATWQQCGSSMPHALHYWPATGTPGAGSSLCSTAPRELPRLWPTGTTVPEVALVLALVVTVLGLIGFAAVKLVNSPVSPAPQVQDATTPAPQKKADPQLNPAPLFIAIALLALLFTQESFVKLMGGFAPAIFASLSTVATGVAAFWKPLNELSGKLISFLSRTPPGGQP